MPEFLHNSLIKQGILYVSKTLLNDTEMPGSFKPSSANSSSGEVYVICLRICMCAHVCVHV